MKNIVILAAGPPKPNRNRHLEINPFNQPAVEEIKVYTKKLLS